jgi:hypothetical protein
MPDKQSHCISPVLFASLLFTLLMKCYRYDLMSEVVASVLIGEITRLKKEKLNPGTTLIGGLPQRVKHSIFTVTVQQLIQGILE